MVCLLSQLVIIFGQETTVLELVPILKKNERTKKDLESRCNVRLIIKG